MTLAVPFWEGRISPVFDVAGHLLLVQVDNGRERSRDEKSIDDHSLCRWTSLMTELGVDVLICGAISDELSSALARIGIGIIPWTKGEVNHVLSAYLSGQLSDPRFVMPGSRPELRPA